VTAITTVLVDIDGTLVDTNDVHAQAWAEAFADEGFKVAFEQVRPLMGMGSDQMLPRLVSVEKKSEQGERLGEAWLRIFRDKYLPSVQALPGASDLLRALHERGVRIVAASSGEAEIADALLERACATPYLSGRTASNDAERSKPAPDIVEAALKKSGASASETLMIGDTPYDIEAARPVGVGVIALRSGGFPDDKLRGALAIYDDPADLLAHLDDPALNFSGKKGQRKG